jgi:hypothetical protein
MGHARARGWLATEAVQAVLARSISGPRETLLALGHSPEAVQAMPAIPAAVAAVTAVLADEIDRRAETEVTARYVSQLAGCHAIGRVDGIRDAAAHLRLTAGRRQTTDPSIGSLLEAAGALEGLARDLAS